MSNHAKNKFDIICNTVDNGIIVLNKDLKVFFWNRWLETRTGIEANSIIDKNILDFYSNIDEKKLKRKIITALNSDIEEIIKEIKTLSKDIDVKSTQNFVDNYNQFKIIKTSSNVISFIAFFLGLLGIVSLMSITVNQRKSEFGIKRALGIKTSKIVYSIIIESFLIGLFSFICAFILSNIVLFFIKNVKTLQGYVNGEISLDLAIYIFVTSILMAIIGSIIPALNAAKTDPVLLIQGNKI
jgi:PAS domain S-box-containing protein